MTNTFVVLAVAAVIMLLSIDGMRLVFRGTRHYLCTLGARPGAAAVVTLLR